MIYHLLLCSSSSYQYFHSFIYFLQSFIKSYQHKPLKANLMKYSNAGKLMRVTNFICSALFLVSLI